MELLITLPVPASLEKGNSWPHPPFFSLYFPSVIPGHCLWLGVPILRSMLSGYKQQSFYNLFHSIIAGIASLRDGYKRKMGRFSIIRGPPNFEPVVSVPPMFTWTTQAPLHLLPSTQGNLNISTKASDQHHEPGLHLGTSYLPLQCFSAHWWRPPAVCGNPHWPSSKYSQLLISRNFVSQAAPHWEVEISHGGSIYIMEIAEASKQHTTAFSFTQESCSSMQPTKALSFLSHIAFPQVGGLSLLLSASSDE